MRIAVFDDHRIGIVASDDTLADVTGLLERYEQLGPEDLLPDLIEHFDELRPELERIAAKGGGTPFEFRTQLIEVLYQVRQEIFGAKRLVSLE